MVSVERRGSSPELDVAHRSDSRQSIVTFHISCTLDQHQEPLKLIQLHDKLKIILSNYFPNVHQEPTELKHKKNIASVPHTHFKILQKGVRSAAKDQLLCAQTMKKMY